MKEQDGKMIAAWIDVALNGGEVTREMRHWYSNQKGLQKKV